VKKNVQSWGYLQSINQKQRNINVFTEVHFSINLKQRLPIKYKKYLYKKQIEGILVRMWTPKT
jgi:hypothetical protein